MSGWNQAEVNAAVAGHFCAHGSCTILLLLFRWSFTGVFSVILLNSVVARKSVIMVYRDSLTVQVHASTPSSSVRWTSSVAVPYLVSRLPTVVNTMLFYT